MKQNFNNAGLNFKLSLCPKGLQFDQMLFYFELFKSYHHSC